MSKAPFHYGQRRLESDLVTLEPFDPAIHTAHIVQVIKAHPELFRYVSFPDIQTEADFKTRFWDKNFRASTDSCLYAILDNIPATTATRRNEEEGDVENKGEHEGVTGSRSNGKITYAGILSLSATNPTNACTELGVIIFPAFQRTHISTHAIGLALLWTLDAPSSGGLGLRRVEWQTHAENAASRRAALRMGFELEGIARWQRAVPRGSEGALDVDALERRNGTSGEMGGRHTAVFSIVWEEWEGKRAAVVEMMGRRR